MKKALAILAVLAAIQRPATAKYDGVDLSTAYVGPSKSLDAALTEWRSKPRRMGCAPAAIWLQRRVPRFHPLTLRRTLPDGTTYYHVVSFDGVVVVDLMPLNDTTPSGRWVDQVVSDLPPLPADYFRPKAVQP